MVTKSLARRAYLPLPVQVCWEAMFDPVNLVSWLGVVSEVEVLSPDRYRAVLVDSVGPIQLSADIEVSAIRTGDQLTLSAEGRDRQLGSTLRADGVIRLIAGKGSTELSMSGTYSVESPLGALGSRSIVGKAEKMADELISGLTSLPSPGDGPQPHP